MDNPLIKKVIYQKTKENTFFPINDYFLGVFVNANEIMNANKENKNITQKTTSKL